jgi:hypothetical protein
MRNFLNQNLESIKPKYNELTAYLTALTCVVLFLSHPDFRQAYFEIITGAGAGRASIAFLALGLIAALGFLLSIIHVFTSRYKSPFEKTCMGVFVMGANGVAGFAAGIELLPSNWSILMLIPLWNIFMGAFLLYQIGVMEYAITDENASLYQVIYASIILLVVFAITYVRFHLTWAMTFSICMFYSTTVIFLITSAIKYFNIHPFAKE